MIFSYIIEVKDAMAPRPAMAQPAGPRSPGSRVCLSPPKPYPTDFATSLKSKRQTAKHTKSTKNNKLLETKHKEQQTFGLYVLIVLCITVPYYLPYLPYYLLP